MAHTYVSCLMHCVFATKRRAPVLTSDICERLHPVIGGIARDHCKKALTVGGTEDHVHVLLSLPATLSTAEAMHRVKGASSRWLRETFPATRECGWQEGYGAFSISVAGVRRTRVYIEGQVEHHRHHALAEEMAAFLARHGLVGDVTTMLG